MSKSYKRKSIEQEKEEAILDLRRELYKEDVVAESETVNLQLQVSARVKLTGKVSGKQYVWPKSGAIIPVNKEDVNDLLKKKLGEKPCCGGKPNYLFVKVE